jgi:hypothetical protein
MDSCAFDAGHAPGSPNKAGTYDLLGGTTCEFEAKTPRQDPK